MKNNIKEAASKAHAKRAAWIVNQYTAKKKTMEQIAGVLGVTRQRISQILKSEGVSK